MKQVLTAVVVLGIASSAFGQGPGGRGFGGGGGVLGLLSVPEVQQELNMSAAQVEKFRSLREEGGDQQTLTREERQARAEELAKRADELVKREFNEQQQLRLSELRIQREGASSLARKDVAEKLGLDQAQQDQITKIQSENTATTARFNFRSASQEEREKWMAEARERREKTEAALLAILTEAQKELFEKMQGARFTFPQGRRRSL